MSDEYNPLLHDQRVWKNATPQPADTERQAREFWERVLCECLVRLDNEDMPVEVSVSGSCELADAALAEWRKRWQKEGQ